MLHQKGGASGSAELPERSGQVGPRRGFVAGLHGLDAHVDDLALRVAHEDGVGLKAVVRRDGVGDPAPVDVQYRCQLSLPHCLTKVRVPGKKGMV